MGEEERQTTEPTPSPEPTPSGGEVSGGLKALFIIVAIVSGLVGIILGIIWSKKESKEEKALGKLTLTIGIIKLVLEIICVCVWFGTIGLGVLGGLEDFSMLLGG